MTPDERAKLIDRARHLALTSGSPFWNSEVREALEKAAALIEADYNHILDLKSKCVWWENAVGPIGTLAAERRDALELAENTIEFIRKCHSQIEDYCSECGLDWPCTTQKYLTAHDKTKETP